MAIYGELPVSDCLSLVVCKKCNRVIKSEALAKHTGQYTRLFVIGLPSVFVRDF